MKNTPSRRPPVRKAASPSGDWVAVYDQNANLIGIVDPAKITPVVDSAPAEPITKQALKALEHRPDRQVQIAKAMDVAALRKLRQIRARPVR